MSHEWDSRLKKGSVDYSFAILKNLAAMNSQWTDWDDPVLMGP
jgi:hypothetical protein